MLMEGPQKDKKDPSVCVCLFVWLYSMCVLYVTIEDIFLRPGLRHNTTSHKPN